MKLLLAAQDTGGGGKESLRIDGKPFPVPQSIQHVMDRAGYFGGNIFSLGITLMILTAIIIAMFFLVWSGIQWITSEGDKQKLQAAKNRLTYTIVGLIIIFLSFFIVSIVGVFFNVPLDGKTPGTNNPVPNCTTRGDCPNRPTPSPYTRN